MEMDVWHGYQSGSLHDCQKISLSDPFFGVTVPFWKMKSCVRKLLVIQKYRRLDSQICFYRMPMNNTDEEKMSEYLVWESKQERMCISRLWKWWKEQVLKIVRVILVFPIVSLQEDNQVKLLLGSWSGEKQNWHWWKRKTVSDISQVGLYISMMISLSWGRVF